MFPTGGLPLAARPSRWNEHLVPFIEAETDRDLAFCLGMVHAHLREAQMEFLKMLAYGRLAEFLGPSAVDVDHAIRIVDFARAAAEIEGRMPERDPGLDAGLRRRAEPLLGAGAAALAGVQAPGPRPRALDDPRRLHRRPARRRRLLLAHLLPL